jgi:hypothetical protein
MGQILFYFAEFAETSGEQSTPANLAAEIIAARSSMSSG